MLGAAEFELGTGGMTGDGLLLALAAASLFTGTGGMGGILLPEDGVLL